MNACLGVEDTEVRMAKGTEVLSGAHTKHSPDVSRAESSIPAGQKASKAALASQGQQLIASSLVFSITGLSSLPEHHQMQGCNLLF